MSLLALRKIYAIRDLSWATCDPTRLSTKFGSICLQSHLNSWHELQPLKFGAWGDYEDLVLISPKPLLLFVGVPWARFLKDRSIIPIFAYSICCISLKHVFDYLVQTLSGPKKIFHKVLLNLFTVTLFWFREWILEVLVQLRNDPRR